MYLKADASSQHLSYKYFKGWRMLVTPGDRRLLNVSALNCVCLNYVANASQKLRNINMYHVRHMYSRIPTRPKMIYNVSMHFGHVPGRLSGRPLQGRAIRKASHWAVAPTWPGSPYPAFLRSRQKRDLPRAMDARRTLSNHFLIINASDP